MKHHSEHAARDAIARLFDGEVPEDVAANSYGSYTELISELLRAHSEGGLEAVHRVFEAYARTSPDIAALRAADEDEDVEEPSPLPTELTEGLELGWIDWYTCVATELTGAPPEFNQLITLVLVATVIQRRARLPMSFGEIDTNCYGVIVAASSVYHKSTALALMRKLLRLAGMEHLILSELQTSEGLLTEMQDRPHGLIIRDEIGTLFASNRTKYLQQLKPDLTALYDGYPYSRRLRHEEIKVEKPYLNIIGATTPERFGDGIRYSDWADGFLPRWLMVTPNGDPDFEFKSQQMTIELQRQIEQLATWLAEAAQHDETDFILAQSAHQLWDEWRIHCVMDAYYHGDNITAAIVSRYSTYGLKFAQIIATALGEWGQISLDTMQTAMHLADNYKVHVRRILEQRLDLGISGAKLQRVHEVVRRMDGGQGVTRKILLQYTHMTAKELTPVIEKLLQVGALMEAPTKRGKRYVAVGDSLPIKNWR